MIKFVSSNITSPIGRTVGQNFESVRKGLSALKTLHDFKGIPGQICAGVFSDEDRKKLILDGHTWLESLAIRSIYEALSHTDVNPSSNRTGFILSTTKGNIDELGVNEMQDGHYTVPGATAQKIASAVGITTEPLVICNACISGVTAQVFADRLIDCGEFDTVIICGVDVVSEFCLAGFSSFKALSPEPCRPFDIDRLGLNLGECAATAIVSKCDPADKGWKLVSSHLNNDSHHLSAPSPNGEGLYRAIGCVLKDSNPDSLATICLHGTATMFNDQSESLAVSESGLSDIPVSAYKSYFGHSLGAAGVLETVLTMKSIDEGVIIPVKGFTEAGVSGRINVSCEPRPTDKSSFIKLISGFGGCNGAVLYSKGPCVSEKMQELGHEVISTVCILPDSVSRNGETVDSESTGPALLTEMYKRLGDTNPRYYKMDPYSKLVYVTTGLLVKDRIPFKNPEGISMILFNKSSSVIADRQHLATFKKSDGFYPSPSVFINTLPNVVMGETAVKYGIKGETSLIVLPRKDNTLIEKITKASIVDPKIEYIITGWANADNENDYESEFKLIKINK